MQKEYLNYIDDDLLSNIYSKFGNVLGIVSNPNIENDYEKCFGKVVMRINVKSKKKIYLKDIVEFDETKTKWRSSKPDNNGCVLCLVDPYWCRMYKLDEKIEVPVIVLRSESDGENRRYWEETSYQVMNRNQFLKRMLLYKMSKYSYAQTEAVNNFNDRLNKIKDYYKALNETARNYRIKHDDLTTLRGVFANFRKEIYKEWDRLLLKHYKNNTSKIELRDLIDMFRKETSNVIDFKSS